VAFYRSGRLRKLVHLVGLELVLEQEFVLRVRLSLGVSQVSPGDKMATNLQYGDIILLSFPHFSLIMMRVGLRIGNWGEALAS
jgi:hypothetical protein